MNDIPDATTVAFLKRYLRDHGLEAVTARKDDLCHQLCGQFQLSCLSDEIISWRVDPHHFWLPPTACGCCPAPGMKLASLFIKISSLFANCYCLTAIPLLRRNEFDAAMAVLVVIPIHKRRNPLAGFFFAAE